MKIIAHPGTIRGSRVTHNNASTQKATLLAASANLKTELKVFRKTSPRFYLHWKKCARFIDIDGLHIYLMHLDNIGLAAIQIIILI